MSEQIRDYAGPIVRRSDAKTDTAITAYAVHNLGWLIRYSSRVYWLVLSYRGRLPNGAWSASPVLTLTATGTFPNGDRFRYACTFANLELARGFIARRRFAHATVEDRTIPTIRRPVPLSPVTYAETEHKYPAHMVPNRGQAWNTSTVADLRPR